MPTATASIDNDEDPREPSPTAVPGVFWELAAAIHRRPEAAFRDDLASGRLDTANRELARVFSLPPAHCASRSWPDVQATWASLYSANPGGLPAPPYVGMALDGELLGPSAARLAAWLDGHGLSVADEWADMNDHVALVADAGGALSDAGLEAEALDLLQRFLAPWFERYAPAVAQVDPDLYGPLELLLRDASREVCCAVPA